MSEKNMGETEQKIPVVEGFLFFYPMQEITTLLNSPTAIKHGYEEARNPGWLTWRTFSKFLGSLVSMRQIRPSTIKKMDRLLADKPELEPLRPDLDELEFLWRPYHEWSALIASRCLHKELSKRYWQSLVDKERELVAELRHALSIHDKLRILLESDLVSEPGCSLARQDAKELLSVDPPSGGFDAYPELIRFRLCAFSSMLLRFAAWLAAEWEYLTASYKVRVPLETFLPQFSPVSGVWNNPVSLFLDHMADKYGCPSETTASAFLGRVWAEHEFLNDNIVYGQRSDIASKQKLLRNWIRREGGRPEYSSIKGLTEAVAYQQASPDSDELKAVSTGYAMAMVFLETCREFRLSLSKYGLPNAMIEEVFASFNAEYRKASQAIAEAGDS